MSFLFWSMSLCSKYCVFNESQDRLGWWDYRKGHGVTQFSMFLPLGNENLIPIWPLNFTISLSQINGCMYWLIGNDLKNMVPIRNSYFSQKNPKHFNKNVLNIDTRTVGLLFSWTEETDRANSKEDHPQSHYSIICYWHEVKSTNYFKNTLISP